MILVVDFGDWLILAILVILTVDFGDFDRFLVIFLISMVALGYFRG